MIRILLTISLILLAFTSINVLAQETEYHFYDKDKTSVVRETFKNNLNKWVLDNNWVKAEISNNSFLVSCKNYKNSSGLTYIKVPITKSDNDFQIETRYKVISGAGGLIFGMNDNFDHYRIEFAEKNREVIILKDRVSKGKVAILQSFKNKITPNTFHTVTLRKVGERFIIYIDEQMLTQLETIDLFGDKIGFSVSVKSKIQVKKLDVDELPGVEYILAQKKPKVVSSDITFLDKNSNKAIDRNEQCAFSFKLTNSGRRDAKNINIELSTKNKAISFTKNRQSKAELTFDDGTNKVIDLIKGTGKVSLTLPQIEAKKSVQITIPVISLNVQEPGDAAFQAKFSADGDYVPDPIKITVELKTIDIRAIVEKFINDEIDKWIVKGKFETSTEYKARVSNQNRKRKIEEFKNDIVNQLAIKHTEIIIDKNEFDADNKVFKVFFKKYFDPVYVKVPSRKAAMNFDKNFSKLKFENVNYGLSSMEQFAISNASITYPGADTSFYFDRMIPITFKSFKVKNSFDDEIKLDLSGGVIADEGSLEIEVGEDQYENIDNDIPIYDGPKQRNTYVLIFGNEDYKSYQSSLTAESNVDFAINDARAFYNYCIKTLGIPSKNIRFKQNVISTAMRQQIKWLQTRAEFAPNKQDIELILYYSGHGFPDENKESYIMPVDISGANVKNGIKLSQLYDEFKKLEMKQTTIFLDACFSGGGREQGLLAAKGIKIKPRLDKIESGKLVVFSASTGEQESLFYRDKNHGMFTYFLLKKIQETKGNVTYGELFDYLKYQVPLKSTDIYNKVQQPEVNVSKGLSESWRNITLR